MSGFAVQELSQEKQWTFELLEAMEPGEKETATTEENLVDRDSEDPREIDLLQDLQHIEEQMRVQLMEKEQAQK